jgi:hypothetical protein
MKFIFIVNSNLKSVFLTNQISHWLSKKSKGFISFISGYVQVCG